MTTPAEKTNALINARRLLVDLLDPSKTPRVPRAIRTAAYYAIKHYPALYELERLEKTLTKLFGDKNDIIYEPVFGGKPPKRRTNRKSRR